MTELINHPSHYNKLGRKECIQEMIELYGRHVTAIFCLGNAYKYLYRAGEKDGSPKEQDIEKAKWYFNFVDTHLNSAIRGSKCVKLFNDVRKGLKSA